MNRQMSSSVYPVRLSGWSKYAKFLYESQKYCHILFGKEEVKRQDQLGYRYRDFKTSIHSFRNTRKSFDYLFSLLIQLCLLQDK